MSKIYRTFHIVIILLAAFFAEAVLLSSFATVVTTQKIEVMPASPKQGETLEVFVTLPSGAEAPAVTFNGKSYKLFDVKPEPGAERTLRALIGVPADLSVGSHQLVVGEQAQNVTVKAGGFGAQAIRLSKEKDNFISSPGEEDAVAQAKATVSEKQLWTGRFVPPSNARTSARFGLRRKVNGRLLTDYFHSGIDYAGGLGSPIVAPQAGRVILTHTGWRLHGSVIAIDHGQGVISFYIHLSKILVKPGQLVSAGQTIGKIGATGRASGPHLHFSLYVNGDATNPLDWFSKYM